MGSGRHVSTEYGEVVWGEYPDQKVLRVVVDGL